MMIRTSRRTLIKGAAATATITGPFLRLLERPARAAAPAKRLVTLGIPNGLKGGLDPANPLSAPILKVFEPLMPKVNVLVGLDRKSAYKTPIPTNHGPDFPNVLTAVQPPKEGEIAGVSLDQYLAARLGKQTAFGLLQLGAFGSSPVMCTTGGGAIIQFESDPRKVFDRVFRDFVPGAGAAGSDPTAMQRLRAERLSMLDTVLQDLADVRCQLGTQERPRFDAHVTAVRELEKNLSFDNGNATKTSACQKPAAPAPTSATDMQVPLSDGSPNHEPITQNSDWPIRAQQQVDLAAVILACDRTRVISFCFTRYLAVLSWLGIANADHTLAHYMGQGMTKDQQTADNQKIEAWHAQQLANLCTKLNAIQDGERTLLDNTAALLFTEHSDGLSHDRRNNAYVLIGSCGGVFKTGRTLRFNGASHADLLVSLANAFDVPTTTYGDPDFSTGPLVGL